MNYNAVIGLSGLRQFHICCKSKWQSIGLEACFHDERELWEALKAFPGIFSQEELGMPGKGWVERVLCRVASEHVHAPIRSQKGLRLSHYVQCKKDQRIKDVRSLHGLIAE